MASLVSTTKSDGLASPSEEPEGESTKKGAHWIISVFKFAWISGSFIQNFGTTYGLLRNDMNLSYDNSTIASFACAAVWGYLLFTLLNVLFRDAHFGRRMLTVFVASIVASVLKIILQSAVLFPFIPTALIDWHVMLEKSVIDISGNTILYCLLGLIVAILSLLIRKVAKNTK